MIMGHNLDCLLFLQDGAVFFVWAFVIEVHLFHL